MKQVVLKPLFHRNQECIGIYFENSPVLNGAIRKHAGAKWSQTNRCWYLSLSRESYNWIARNLKGKAELNNTELKECLAKRKKITAAVPSATVKKDKIKSPVLSSAPVWKLNEINLSASRKATAGSISV